MLDNLFWQKVSQSLDYLTHLAEQMGVVCDTKGKTVLSVKGPVLRCVLVTDRARNRRRIAVFVCEPKGNSGKFQMAAMWRKECNLEELDKAYGCFINAVFYLRTAYTKNQHPGEVWQYLGPDCSKVTVNLENDGTKVPCLIVATTLVLGTSSL